MRSLWALKPSSGSASLVRVADVQVVAVGAPDGEGGRVHGVGALLLPHRVEHVRLAMTAVAVGARVRSVHGREGRWLPREVLRHPAGCSASGGSDDEPRTDRGRVVDTGGQRGLGDSNRLTRIVVAVCVGSAGGRARRVRLQEFVGPYRLGDRVGPLRAISVDDLWRRPELFDRAVRLVAVHAPEAEGTDLHVSVAANASRRLPVMAAEAIHLKLGRVIRAHLDGL